MPSKGSSEKLIPCLAHPSASSPLELAMSQEYVVEVMPRGSKMCSLTYRANGIFDGRSSEGRQDKRVYMLLLY